MAWVLVAHTGPYVVGTSHIDILLLQLRESSKSLISRYYITLPTYCTDTEVLVL